MVLELSFLMEYFHSILSGRFFGVTFNLQLKFY